MPGRLPSNAPDVTTLLFDLDGTLVDMKRLGVAFRLSARAVWRYFGAIRPWHLGRATKEAIARMQTHGSDKTNYQVFLETMSRHSRTSIEDVERRSRLLVSKDFATLAHRFYPVPGAKETVLLARELGYRTVLATNPVWPLDAVRMRMTWGGLGEVPFDYITHSEIMTRCKPDPAYYRQLLERLSLSAAECVMIGNDPRKDLPAKDAGIRTFLIARDGAAMPEDPRLDGWGTFEEFQGWLKRSAEERWPNHRSLSA